MNIDDKIEKIHKLQSRGREFRLCAEFRALEGQNNADELWVEGCAIVFDNPTVLFEHEGVEYREIIDSHALDNCDMTDVIMNINHAGYVVARTRNNTLLLEVRPDGLWIRARLDGTAEGRRLHEAIRGGYIDRMSFQFVPAESQYDRKSNTNRITAIRKLYDVSAVDIPAYDTTIIAARSLATLDSVAKTVAEAAIRTRKRIVAIQTQILINQTKRQKERMIQK